MKIGFWLITQKKTWWAIMQRFKTTAARKLIENMEGEKEYIYAIISDNV